MRKGIIVELSTADRARLEAVVADRNSPQKHVWRARIVLLTANGHGTALIMRQAGVSKVAVWRWQERFMTAGVEGLLRDKTRPSRIPALGVEVTARVVTLTTTGDPPGETTHWTATAMAQLVGISASSVQRIWRAHGLQPHRVKAFKLSNDPVGGAASNRREAARHRRAVRRPAGPRHRALGRREIADPGLGSHPSFAAGG